jgi:hypothetical protein
VEAGAALLCATRFVIVQFNAKGSVEGTDGATQFDATAQQAGLLYIDLQTIRLGKGPHGVKILLGCAVTSRVFFA